MNESPENNLTMAGGTPPLHVFLWAVYELPDGSRHVAGYVSEYSNTRVTSAISGFDPLAGTVVTTSEGSVYKLVGSPGISMDVARVWGRFLENYELVEYHDESYWYWEKILAAEAMLKLQEPRQ